MNLQLYERMWECETTEGAGAGLETIARRAFLQGRKP